MCSYIWGTCPSKTIMPYRTQRDAINILGKIANQNKQYISQVHIVLRSKDRYFGPAGVAWWLNIHLWTKISGLDSWSGRIWLLIWETEIGLPLGCTPTRDWTGNWSMHPERELNPRPFSTGTALQPSHTGRHSVWQSIYVTCKLLFWGGVWRF